MFNGLSKFVYYWNYERPHQGIKYVSHRTILQEDICPWIEHTIYLYFEDEGIALAPPGTVISAVLGQT
jgi:hypothetical protein